MSKSKLAIAVLVGAIGFQAALNFFSNSDAPGFLPVAEAAPPQEKACIMVGGSSDESRVVDQVNEAFAKGYRVKAMSSPSGRGQSDNMWSWWYMVLMCKQ